MASVAETGTDQHGAQAASHGHPTAKTYVLVAIVLTAITALEVAIFYIPTLHPVMVPLLVTLSAVKFSTVVLFYMHLRFDSPLFGRVFFGPMLLAIVVVISMIILFHVLPQYNL